MLEEKEWFVKFHYKWHGAEQLQVRKNEHTGMYEYRFQIYNLVQKVDQEKDYLYANHAFTTLEGIGHGVHKSGVIGYQTKQYSHVFDMLEYHEDNDGGIWVTQWHQMDGLEEILQKQFIYDKSYCCFDIKFNIDVVHVKVDKIDS